MTDRTPDITDACKRYENLDFLVYRLEDAFDPCWWAKVSGSCSHEVLSSGIRLDDEGRLLLIPNKHH